MNVNPTGLGGPDQSLANLHRRSVGTEHSITTETMLQSAVVKPHKKVSRSKVCCCRCDWFWDIFKTPQIQTVPSPAHSSPPSPQIVPSTVNPEDLAMTRELKEPVIVTKIKEKWQKDKLMLFPAGLTSLTLQAKSSWNSKEKFDLSSKLDSFVKSDQLKRFVVFEDSGTEARKSCVVFCDSLLEKCDGKDLIPFVISLEDGKNFETCVELAFKQLNLTELEEQEALKHQFLFVFLEPFGKPVPNLYKLNNINGIKFKGKTLNASCSKGLVGLRNQYMIPYAVPKLDRPDFTPVEEAFVTENVSQLTTEKTHLDYINMIPALKELVTSPHFFSVTVEVLQGLSFDKLQRLPNDEELKALYHDIIEKSIDQKIAALEKAGIKVESDLKEKVKQAHQTAAKAMKEKGLLKIENKKAPTSYDDDMGSVAPKTDWSFLKDNVLYCSPMEQIGDRLYAFPPTLLEYFATGEVKATPAIILNKKTD